MKIIDQNPPLKKWSERRLKNNKVTFIHKIVKFLNLDQFVPRSTSPIFGKDFSNILKAQRT
jgi:hypothetical protein